MKNKLEKAKINLKLAFMSKLKGPLEVDIPQTPDKWEHFDNTKDMWAKVSIPSSEDSTACLYKASKGSIFQPHRHKSSKEHLTILNTKGKMKVIIEDTGEYQIEYPNSIVINPNKIHAVEFLEETVLMVIWHPSFKDKWEAEFTEKS